MGSCSIHSLYRPLWDDSSAQRLDVLRTTLVSAYAMAHHLQIPHRARLVRHRDHALDSDPVAVEMESERALPEAERVGA